MEGIGTRLREERNRLKLSQSAFGAIGGVETNAQGNYESGARFPKADYLLRITEAGVDINFVLTGRRLIQTNEITTPAPPPKQAPVQDEHLGIVTHQLHRSLHGLIDALFQMSAWIESRANGTRDENLRNELETIKGEAQALAEASVRLIFVTSRLS